MTETQKAVPDEAVEPEYRAIMRKTSYVLLVIGVIEICWTAYGAANNSNASVKYDLVNVINGLLLLWGGLRIASAIRWLAVLVLGVQVSGALLAPFIQPWSLTRAQLHLTPPEEIAFALVYSTFYIALTLWLAFMLGKPAIQTARTAAGRPRRDMRIPAALGAGSMLVFFIVLHVSFTGDSAEKAIAMAEQTTGPGYQYRVAAMEQSTKSVTAIVTAWSDEQVRNIQVGWDKP